jgi:D-3-phosphoglycerate dehydrogenase
MVRILVSDNLSKAGLAVLEKAPGVELDYQPGLDEQKLALAIKSADGLVIRSGSKVTARVIEAAERLRVVGRAGIGVDNVDVEAASKRGIAVMNTPTGNATTTAEHAIALMLSLARWIPAATLSMKAGRWEKNKFQGSELAGKTLGVIGLGTIGRIVADRARGLKMRVLGTDPVLSAERAAALGVELVTLDDIWREADVITVHTPLTPDTTGLINDTVIERLRRGVLLVNCARGGIFDEDAVLRGLESGRIGGAAFDVFVEEPPPKGHALVAHERVVCTPHLGASTHEAQERVAVEIAEQVVAFLASGELKNAVNAPAISGELASQIAPYRRVAERLGRFLAQVERIVPQAVEVECGGLAAAVGSELISAAALVGLFEYFLDVPVNSISAPHLAADRGVTVRELTDKSAKGAHASEITLRVRDRDGGEHVVLGTIGSDGSPRLLRWRDFAIEATLEGTALVVESIDKPGVIGFLGTTLGNAQINVAAVHLGKSANGQALSIWNLDNDVPPDVLASVNASDNITRALVIRL